jgi:ferredoxin
MDRLDLVEAGLRARETRLPDVVPSLCVATRYRASTCRRCLDVCPGGAIEPSPWLRVDPGRCTSCGACAAACRTGALSYRARDTAFREGLAAAAEAGSGSITIICGVAAAAGRAEAALTIPCLGGLSAAHLVAAAASGAAQVDLISGTCDVCANREAGLTVAATADVAGAICAAAGRVLPVAVHERPAAAPAAAASSDSSPVMSRREVFSYLGRSARRAAADTLQPAKRTVQDLHAQAPPPALHRWLAADTRRLGAVHGRPIGDSVAPSPQPAVSIEGDCAGCDICARYCPHGALSCVSGSVAMRSELCTACGLCVEVCPRASLVLLQGERAGAAAR